MKPRSEVARADVVAETKAQESKTVFVPVSLPPPVSPAQTSDVRIGLEFIAMRATPPEYTGLLIRNSVHVSTKS